MTRSQLLVSSPETTPGTPRYSLLVARDNEEVRAAQRLRHLVFAEEMGATLHSIADGVDADAFDERCDHLVVREDETGEIVGTYRMLPPEHADGGLYAETEFDLRNLSELRPALVEAGRSCVHPDHRSGSVVGLIWAGLARYMLLSGHKWLAGCASVPLADGGSYAAGVWNAVSAKHLSPEEYRVTPLNPWDPESVEAPQRTVMPPLLKGYLRLGTWVCGRPAHDPDFGVADLFVLLSMDRLDQRYLKFFLGQTA